MKLHLHHLTTIVSGAHFVWQTTVKGGRALGAGLAKVLHFREGGATSRWYNAIMAYAKFVVTLQRQNGWAYVVIYLKACCVLLQQAAGGFKIDNTRDLKCAVSRTRSGIPRVIPPRMRRAVQSKDIWTIRIWLTLFRLYQVIDMRCTVKLESISAPSTMDIGILLDWANFLNAFVPCFFREVGYFKVANRWPWSPGRNIRKDAAVTNTESYNGTPATGLPIADQVLAWLLPKGWEGASWGLRPKLMALLTSSPNTGGVRTPFILPAKLHGKDNLVSPTSIGAVFSDCCAWKNPMRDTDLEALRGNLYPILIDWLRRVEDRAITRLFELFDKMMGGTRPLVGPLEGYGRLQGLGKLSLKPEPAGKTRVFAMVDSVSQMVLKPVHDRLFSLLRVIEQDGTFDQMAPAKRLVAKGLTSFWSFDLSSATDRFPILLQHTVMGLLLGPAMASEWAALLVMRPYLVPAGHDQKIKPFKVPSEGVVTYGAGQPMGAYTSWAAFSLTHHILVQWAAYKAYAKISWFKDYALLGDDIVLADAKVAREYLLLIRAIGVEVGLAKSLISSNGSFEFAKRTFICGQDASHVSLLALGAAKADHSVLEQLLSRLGRELSAMQALRIGAKVLGYGYRTVARLPAVLSTRSRLQGMAILLTRTGSPWGLSVRDWFLQASPGKVREIADRLEMKVSKSVWVKLQGSLLASLNAHLRGMAKVRRSDAYGTGATVMDPGNWHLNAWEYYVVGSILSDMRARLGTIQERVKSLVQPTVLELNALYEEIDVLREELDAIPVVPNIVERARLEFGGKKRSATIRLWRSISRMIAKALASNDFSDV